MHGCQLAAARNVTRDAGLRLEPQAAGASGAGHRPPQPLRAADAVRLRPTRSPTLIATSQEHFEAGERELKVGHLERARAEFDRAVDVMLESPYGARTDARMREHFDRLVDRINAYEVTALAQGDGFAEKKYEPASIDELLKIATFPKPDADAQTTAAVKAGPGGDRARRSDSAELRACWRTSSCSRAGCANSSRTASRAARKYLPMIQDVFRAEGLAARPRLHSDHRERLQAERRCRRPARRARGSS